MLIWRKNNFFFFKNKVAFFHAFFFERLKMPVFSRVRVGGGGTTKWFVFNKHEVLFFSENAWKKEKCVKKIVFFTLFSRMSEKSLFSPHFTFFHAFSKNINFFPDFLKKCWRLKCHDLPVCRHFGQEPVWVFGLFVQDVPKLSFWSQRKHQQM
jgi:hypothetical protein